MPLFISSIACEGKRVTTFDIHVPNIYFVLFNQLLVITGPGRLLKISFFPPLSLSLIHTPTALCLLLHFEGMSASLTVYECLGGTRIPGSIRRKSKSIEDHC